MEEFNGEKIANGDVLKTQSKLFVYHYAIYFNENGIDKVVHNSSSKSVIIQTWDDFFEDRKLIDIFETNISGCSVDFIYEKYNELKDKKFDLTGFNCEDFVIQFTDTKLKVKQLNLWYSIGFIGLGSYFIFKNFISKK